MNGEIRSREVRVVDADGNQLGVMSAREALRLAQERDLDLVEIAPNAYPPVCRIMNYGKYRYEQSKKDREARRRQKVVDIKEVRMTPKIGDHDFNVKMRNAQRFLTEGNKVKVSVRFRGREIIHADLARQMLLDMAQQLSAVGQVERPPMVEGRLLIMVLAPRGDRPAAVRNAAAEAEEASSTTGAPAEDEGDMAVSQQSQES